MCSCVYIYIYIQRNYLYGNKFSKSKTLVQCTKALDGPPNQYLINFGHVTNFECVMSVSCLILHYTGHKLNHFQITI